MTKTLMIKWCFLVLKRDLLAPNFSEPKADFGAARQDLAAGFAGALPGPRLTSSSTRAPHKRALTELGKHTHSQS